MELEILSGSSKTEATESISGRFAKITARFPDQIAVSGALGENWSYAELDARSTRIATRILERAKDNSETVAILMEHGPLLIAAILGALKAGKIYLALDSSDPVGATKCDVKRFGRAADFDRWKQRVFGSFAGSSAIRGD